MDTNVTNSGGIDSSGDQRCSLYLPSVKIWNEHVRRNTFVKDHTAVPLPNLSREHCTRNVAQNETTFSSLTSTSPNTESSQFYGADQGVPTQIASNDTQSSSLKKAFEMATRTRDILNKLDGWKGLSIKTYPTSSSQSTVSIPSSTSYMIKSSSQFTKLDASSDEAKNILQNIKDMGQILCPSEYGGVSHFRITNEAKQTNEAPNQETGLIQSDSFIQSKSLNPSDPNISMFQQSNPCISSSRINIIGRSNRQIIQYSPGQNVLSNRTNILGTTSANDCPSMSFGIENGHKPSQISDPGHGNETQRYDYDKMRTLYNDLMTKMNQKSQENIHENFSGSKLSDSLYEDFEDGSFPSAIGQHAPVSSSVLVHSHCDSFRTQYSNSNDVVKPFMHSAREKDHHEWERETQDFLRKLNVKSGGSRKDTREEFSSLRHSTETCNSKMKSFKDETDRHDKIRYGSSVRSSKCSSISIERCGSVGTYDSGNGHALKGLNHISSKARKIEAKLPHKSINSINSKPPFHRESKAAYAKDSLQKTLFFDDCSHGCKDCGLSGMTLTSYLDHLLTNDHIKKITDIPSSWEVKFDETSLSEPKSTKILPIRGSESIYPVTEGFYCRPCKKYFPNKNGLLCHLTSKSHDQECYFYNNSRRKHCDTSSTIPAKRARLDSKDVGAKSIAAPSKNNEVVKTTQISTVCRPTEATIITSKAHSIKVPLNSMRSAAVSQPSTKIVAGSKIQSLKLNPNPGKSIALKPSPANKAKIDASVQSKHFSKSSMVSLSSQKTAEANHADDVESESDFLG